MLHLYKKKNQHDCRASIYIIGCVSFYSRRTNLNSYLISFNHIFQHGKQQFFIECSTNLQWWKCQIHLWNEVLFVSLWFMKVVMKINSYYYHPLAIPQFSRTVKNHQSRRNNICRLKQIKQRRSFDYNFGWIISCLVVWGIYYFVKVLFSCMIS